MSDLQIQCNDDGGQFDEFVNELRLLPKEVAQSFLDHFESFLRAAVVEFSDSGGQTATGTRCGRISLRVVGIDELIAAARAAA